MAKKKSPLLWKWIAAKRLFDRGQRCPDPPYVCAFIESKCQGCEILALEIKAITREEQGE